MARRSGMLAVLGAALRLLLSFAGAALATLVVFLVLPLIQAMAKEPEPDLLVFDMETGSIPPPPAPPPPEEDEPEPEQEEEPPPELVEEAPPLSLEQLELALEPGFGTGLGAGDFALGLRSMADDEAAVDALFSLADLDQEPRVTYQPGPTIGKKLRRRGGATVYVIFVVGRDGRVEEPTAQTSTDPAFERAALEAVARWRFEPGKRNGEPVRFRMRVPITFPEVES